MTDRGWQRLTVALGAVLAVLLGLTAVVVLLPVGSGKPPPTSAAFASQPPSSGAVAPSASARSSAMVSPSPGASPAASASPTAAAVPVATIVFRQIRLDAGIDPVGKARTITFNSDGSGSVTARVSHSSPLSSTRLCVAPTGRSAICHNGSTGTVTRTSTARRTNWTVSLAGVGISTPTIDLTVTFRAAHPSVKLTGFRFDGTSQPGNNGFVARIKARTGGKLSIDASWGVKPFDYTLAVRDVTAGGAPASQSGTGTGARKAFDVTAPDSWEMALANAQDPGVGRVDLTATITWP
jgi:hypothetical protein